MPTLTVRDIPEHLYERLRERASEHQRSMSSETIMLLEKVLIPEPGFAETLIAEAETFHARFPEPLPDLVAVGKRAVGKRAGRKYEDDLISGA